MARNDVDAGTRWSASPGWAAVTAASLAALGWWAPEGLLLLLFLGVVIATHEGGHLVAARRAGMQPTEFFWGFGPELVSMQHNGCRYGLRVLFVGGYVKLHGMTPSADLPPGFDEARTFRAASPLGRLATILAGPGVNLALACFAFGVAAALEGASAPTSAARAVGDVWFVMSGTAEALATWAANLGGYVASVLDASGGTEPPVRFMSPVAQAEVSAIAVSAGPVAALRWFAILSAAVGMVNLVPLPPLDGAHAVVALVDAARSRLAPHARLRSLDITRVAPLAYLTVAALIALSISALVLDLRDLG